MENLNKYKEVFIKLFHVKEEMLDDSFTFRDIEAWDSIMHMILIADLEDVFDVMFETEEILHFESYANGIKLLRNKGVEI